MHVSVSTLTSLHLLTNFPSLGLWIWAFPALIALSALHTKQHFFLDLIPGALVGWIAFEAFLIIYA
jgi:membrane-associated phospholipid phosphatase